jgi:hypothetical protein
MLPTAPGFKVFLAILARSVAFVPVRMVQEYAFVRQEVSYSSKIRFSARVRQRLAHTTEKIGCDEGLWEEREFSQFSGAPRQRGHDQDRQLGFRSLNASREFQAVNTWHGHVGQQECDFGAVLFKHLQGDFAGISAQRGVAAYSEVRLDERSNRTIIIHYEHGSCAYKGGHGGGLSVLILALSPHCGNSDYAFGFFLRSSWNGDEVRG